MTKPKLTANDGMIFTDGIDVFGEIISVGKGRRVDEFYQITKEEYQKILAELELKSEVETE